MERCAVVTITLIRLLCPNPTQLIDVISLTYSPTRTLFHLLSYMYSLTDVRNDVLQSGDEDQIATDSEEKSRVGVMTKIATQRIIM